MTRILMRAGKDPLVPLTPEQSLAAAKVGVFSSNTGNALFYSAVHRALSTPGTTIVPDGYMHERRELTPAHAAKINDSYDHLVLPLANSYKPRFLPHLERLTKLIDRLTIPVSIVGVGAQMPHNQEIKSIDGEYLRVVRNFTASVLERSPSIGVRGEFTAALLRHLGFDESQIHVIGCPSLFTYGPLKAPQFKVEELTPDSKVAFNYTTTVKRLPDFLEPNMAKYRNSVVIAQQHYRLALLLWGENAEIKEDPRFPVHRDHPLYQQDRMRMFVDPRVWFDYLSEFDFNVGTRIHGNIAGVLGGTPSMVLAFDSRTAELAEFCGIPYRMFSEVVEKDVAELYAEVDYSKFEKRQAENFANYVDFLDRHGLEHIFTPGNENPEYDRKLAAADFPGPIHTLAAPGELGRQQIVERIAWLRQGHKGDLARPAYAYRPPMGGPKLTHTDELQKSVRKLEKEVATLREALGAKAIAPKPPASERLKRKARKVVRQVRSRVG